MRQDQGTGHLHLGAIFFKRVEELGERTFIKLQRRDRFEEITWRDFGARVRETILGLYSLGLGRGDRITILSENRLEWLCADVATLAGGLPNVVVSPRLSDARILRILTHSGTRAVFVEDGVGLGRILNLKRRLPSLVAIIVMDQTDSLASNCLTFQGLLSRGSGGGAGRLTEILESVQADDLATIIYTSGSTGEPKGVMRTQENLLSNIKGGTEILPSKPEEVFAIVLSLNHLLGRFGFHKSAVNGRTTAIVEATELDVDLNIIRSLSPTAMTLVPRVMERIWEAFLTDERIRDAWEAIEALEQAKPSEGSPGLDRVRQHEALRDSLRASVQHALGGRIKYVSYAGAPMAPRIMRFFHVIGIPLLGSYGLTECGGVTLSGLGESRPGSLGKPFPNVEVRIAEDGEILVRGPSVTPGYFDNPEATREVLDPDGWFHTGDLGAIDPDGALRVVGRKRDIFYCSDGSNINPRAIELLLENDPFIRQAALVGDHRPFLAALIVPEHARIAAALKKHESSVTPRETEEALWSRLEEVNRRLEEPEKIRKIAVLKRDFPETVRSVTAFQKIKMDRKAVDQTYHGEIEAIYRDKESGGAGSPRHPLPMAASRQSLEDLVRASSHALVIGVGGGGDVVGALAAARFVEFCGLDFTLGGLSWERYVYDPVPGPRALSEIAPIELIHPRVGLANRRTKTRSGVYFAESRMAEVLGRDVLLVDINGGAGEVVDGLEAALERLKADLLIGIDVGGDSLARGDEKGLRSPLADSIMLAAYAEMERRGHRVLWGVFGYGSDGELTTEEVEEALSVVAKAGGLLGAWSLTPRVVAELQEVIRRVHTEASAIPVECALGAWGEKSIRDDRRKVKLTPLTALTFYLSPTAIVESVARPARRLAKSGSLEAANEALHGIGLKTELDLERERLRGKKTL